MGRPFSPRLQTVVGGILLVLILAVNVPPLRTAPFVRGVRGAMLFAVSPFTIGGHWIAGGVSRVGHGIVDVLSALHENEKLRGEIRLIQAQDSVMQDILSDNNRLRNALGFADRNPYHFHLLPAEVIGHSPDAWFETLIINRGRRRQVAPEQAVICPEGLVGRIQEVSEDTSVVLLLEDSRSAVSGAVKRTGTIGLVVGGRGDRLRLEYVPLTADIQSGDIVVTSGVSDIFPKGIPIGVVSKVEKKDNEFFQDVELQPSVHFLALHELFITRR